MKTKPLSLLERSLGSKLMAPDSGIELEVQKSCYLAQTVKGLGRLRWHHVHFDFNSDVEAGGAAIYLVHFYPCFYTSTMNQYSSSIN